MGSQSDWETMRHAADILDALDLRYEKRIVSAHRTPDRLYDYASNAATRGLKVIIAGAGGAAHLPGMTASMTRLPVLGVPVESKALSGMDSLLSIVQMPAGIPVGTLAIGKAGAANAGLLAAAILATSDPRARRAARRLAPAPDRRHRRNARMMPRPAPPSASSAAANWAGCWRWRRRSSATNAISTRPTRRRPPPRSRPISRAARLTTRPRSRASATASTSPPTSSRISPPGR